VTYADVHLDAVTLGVADVTLNTTESATGTIAVSGSGATRTVTITGLTGHGTLGISIAAGSAVDTLGNLALAAGPSGTFIVNHLPVAGADAIERYPTQTVKVKVATLLSNDTDADADVLSLANVTSPSAGGGTVTRIGDWVYYTPAVGFTAADTFTYSVSDTRGGSAPGLVSITIKIDSAASQNKAAIQNMGGGLFRITFDGIPNRTYTVQHAESLTEPVVWITLGPATANSLGIYSIDDPAGSLARFYRSVFP
jgi:hypothetical protein